jgi:oxalate decarboxylase/phosphoglucose isomerase-like protein (cupin superfamily)
MLCLRDISGLPLDVDFELDRVMYDELNLTCSEAKHVPLEEIVPSLLNKALKYPENVYQQHRNLQRAGTQSAMPKISYDLYYLPAGLLGIEYLKTHIFHARKQNGVDVIVEALSGTLTVYMQKDEVQTDPYAFNSIAADIKVVEVKVGQKLAVPAGYYYTFINTTEEAVVFARLGAEEKVVDAQKLVRSNGLAYYLISKNARCEIVNNPRYQRRKELSFASHAELNASANFQPNEVPLYVDFVNNAPAYAQMIA